MNPRSNQEVTKFMHIHVPDMTVNFTDHKILVQEEGVFLKKIIPEELITMIMIKYNLCSVIFNFCFVCKLLHYQRDAESF